MNELLFLKFIKTLLFWMYAKNDMQPAHASAVEI